MKKQKQIIMSLAATAVVALFVFLSCKDEEQKPLPADAGVITEVANTPCPAPSVTLSVAKIEYATAYVWYKERTVIPNETAASYTATQAGAYTVAGVNAEGEGTKSPAYNVTIPPCPGEEGAAPAAAGSITAPVTNVCPSRVVTLTAATITGATSYKWSIAYAADDVEDSITTEPTLVYDFTTLVADQALTFTLSGVNAIGVGEASAPAVVTKALCKPAKPVLTGNEAWVFEAGQHGDTVVYKTVCPSVQMEATAAAEGATSFKWFIQEVGVEPNLRSWPTDGSATLKLGTRGHSFNYVVVAVNMDGESDTSNIIQVIGSACDQPNPPQGNGIGLYPDKSGEYSFYPQEGEPKSFAISNCDIQNKTFKPETSVQLICNGSSANTGNQLPLTGYAFWVKTTENGSFTKVLTTGTATTARKIVVDGTNYPSGTYQVTAVNAHGDSEFGPNWIAVNIRTDCPAVPPVTLAAGTISVAAGATNINNVVSNICPDKEVFDINFTIPSLPYSEGGSNYTWIRLAPNYDTIQHGTQSGFWDASPVYNGTYSVVYTKVINGETYESTPATFTLDAKWCAPTFTKKPTVIVDRPNEYAEAVLNAPNSEIAGFITGYEWYYGNAAATSAEVSAGTAARTYHLKKEGTYTVRAKIHYENTYLDSPFSEQVVLTKVQPPAAYTRADLVGTYTVSEYQRANNGGTLKTYDITVAAHESAADSVIITGLGNSNLHIVKAGVSFTSDGATTGNYGTISVPRQSFLRGSTTYYFKHGINYINPPVCDENPMVFTIKFIEANPGVSQTGVNYGIISNNNLSPNCGAIGSFWGARGTAAYGLTDISSWTKKQ